MLTLQSVISADDALSQSYLNPFLPRPTLEEVDLQKEEAVDVEQKFTAQSETVSIKQPCLLKSASIPSLSLIDKEKAESCKLPSLPEIQEKNVIKEVPTPEIIFKILPKLPIEELSSSPLPEKLLDSGHSINFNDVPMEEFIRFVSKISEVNFIFDKKDLNFNVSLTSGKAVSAENVLIALLRILRMNGFWIKKEEEYFVIHKVDAKNPPDKGWDSFLYDEEKPPVIETPVEPVIEKAPPKEVEIPVVEVIAPEPLVKEIAIEVKPEPVPPPKPYEFFVYKLKYHQGFEIKDALKQVAFELQTQPGTPQKLLSAIQTVQWVKATNSLLCSGDEEAIAGLRKLIESLDTALKQVFIEVLVIETDISKGLEFGLQWGASGQLKNNLGAGASGFPQNGKTPPFAQTMQGINASNTPSGLGQFPVGSGFDLGVIGDVIFHKGKSFLSLGALVSAVQEDGGSTIVLNQKIIAQDNKPSQIFVGDNIPFTGSVTQLVGQNQQTTSNIEYRDIGVNLNIKPMIGDDGVVTLDIQEEISETVDQPGVNQNASGALGIRTTKTNMVTHVHVPDKHFLVLSGMIRNSKSQYKTGLPCLGGIPFVGSLFSKKAKKEEKRNVIIFVRPHIVQNVEDYKKVSAAQRELHRKESSDKEAFDQSLLLIPHVPESE